MTASAPCELTVLVVDDDATTLALHSSLVRRLGHTVLVADSGEAAWRTIESAPVDMIVADWLMPGMDGLELCRRARRLLGDNCSILVVTSRDQAEDLREALAAGADDYLNKPASRDDFTARIIIAQRRLALSRARRQAEAEAAKMRWLAGIGQTVLTVQHELNNPLAALFGLLQLAMCAPGLGPDIRRDLESAMGQAQRIARVVNRLSKTRDPSVTEALPGLLMLALAPDEPDDAHVADDAA